MNVTLDAGGSSFTALLELPSTQVVKLLHSSHDDAAVESLHPPPPRLSSVEFVNSPSIPDPAKRNSPQMKKKKKVKEGKDEEKEDSEVVRESKRKRSKNEDNQLPYVHVRARRGQATDSHSLAERARREKINARMKLLQELVPGCSKISGIALVLDEIINHVQTLQRQVEFLSMQLAAVNPRIEYNLDQLLDEENASFVVGNLLSMHPPLGWSEPEVDGFKRSFVQQWQYDQYQHPQWLKEENHHESVTMPYTTHLRNDSSPDLGCMQPKQPKVEQI